MEDCTVSSMNDFSCSINSPCNLLCGSGSVGRLVASPNTYMSNEAMAWIIGLEKVGVSLKLTFTNFNTEGNCDFVQVYSCSSSNCQNTMLLGQYSGNTLPAELRSSTGLMKIVWTSDYSVDYSGWRAEWTISESGHRRAGASVSRSVAGGESTRSTRSGSSERRLQTATVRPVARMGHGFVALQVKLYVFGGWGEAGKRRGFMLPEERTDGG